MLCQSTLSSWYDFKTILFSLLLLSIYWFALSLEDYHHWNARQGILVEEMKKDELNKLEVRKTEGS